MQFDNSKTVIKLNKRRYITILAYAMIMIIIFFSGWFKEPLLGIEKAIYVIVITVIYVFYIIIAYITNHSFFSFSNDGENLVFKYVSLRPFDDKRKSIILKKDLYKGAKIRIGFFNLKKELVVYAQTQNGTVAYPPISISALSAQHIMVLKNTLQIR